MWTLPYQKFLDLSLNQGSQSRSNRFLLKGIQVGMERRITTPIPEEESRVLAREDFNFGAPER